MLRCMDWVSMSQKQINPSAMVCSPSCFANFIREQCELLNSEEAESFSNPWSNTHTTIYNGPTSNGMVGTTLFGICSYIMVTFFLLLEA